MTTMHGLVSFEAALSAADLQAIRSLEARRLRAGIHCKIDPHLDHGVVLSRDGELVGFMTVDDFGGPDLESFAIADEPDEWDAMAAEVTARARAGGLTRVLFIVDSHDRVALERMTALDLPLTMTEFRMEHAVGEQAIALRTPANEEITLRRATTEDSSFLRALRKGHASTSESKPSPEEIAETRIVLDEQRPVGALRLETGESTCGIYGLVISRGHRGRGLGTGAMSAALEEILGAGLRSAFLEVDETNGIARHVYEQLGFRYCAEFRYYALSLT